jgi:hypothetical protein
MRARAQQRRKEREGDDDMAQIDRHAALEELKRAARLKAKAEELGNIADELVAEAESHEDDALDLIAPGRTSRSSNGRHH